MTPGHNLVLTGFMGTGKTSVGQELASMLDMEFVDTDALIESRHGPIATIFADQGEARFRELEAQLAKELGQRHGLVIATGGRMVLDPSNHKELSRNGRIFCLVATPDEIYARMTSDEIRRDRPLLQGDNPRERIIELMTQRHDEYRRFPQVATGHGGPSVIAEEIAQLWHGLTSFDVSGPEGGYAFTVGVGILPFVRQLASIRGPVVVITDEAVADLYASSLGEVDVTVVLASGPPKIMDSVRTVHDELFATGVDESATLVALGPSTIGDIAGFAAATYLRGLDLVSCPTDLIAMLDTSVGGTVALDIPQDPNLIGPYKQPKAVVADVGTLQTLPRRAFVSGLAEVIKHGLIGSSSLLDRIGKTSWSENDLPVPRRLADLQSLVARTIQVKIGIVQDDPFEAKGRRTVLNLGHTFAYGVEHASGGEVNHGEAVAMGLVAAARLSHLLGYAHRDLPGQVETIVGHVGLEPLLPPTLEIEAVLEAMLHDRNPQESRPRFVLLRDVGDAFVTDDVTQSDVAAVLEGMRTRATGPD